MSGVLKLYFFGGGAKLAEYSNGTTYFFHTDHLGTPKSQTSISGSVVETWSNFPFGEQWIASGGIGNEHRFTGHRRDPGSGNDSAGARDYSSSQGRWLSVDPVLGGLYDPQRLNRYPYVLGDPVNFVDRDGLEPCRIGGGIDCELTVWGNLPYSAAMAAGFFPEEPQELVKIFQKPGPIGEGDGDPEFIFFKLVRRLWAIADGQSGALKGKDDCKALVTIVNAAANLFPDAFPFVAALTHVLTEIMPVTGDERPDAGETGFVGLSAFRSSGFKSDFINHPDDNQVRHFVAGLMAGFYYGRLGGKIIMDWFRNETDVADLKLNSVSIRLGAHLRWGSLTPEDLGAAIQNSICEKTDP